MSPKGKFNSAEFRRTCSFLQFKHNCQKPSQRGEILFTIGHGKLFYAHCPKIAFLYCGICIRFQERSSERGNVIQCAQIFLFAILFLKLRVDQTILGEHESPFSSMATGTVLALLVLNNAFFIKQIHKSEFIITPMKVSDKGRACKYRKALLNTVGVAKTGITYQPYFNLFAHNATSNQYPTNRYSCTEFRWVFASL